MKLAVAPSLLAPVFALAALALPAVSHAQFRATAHLGVEHLARGGADTTMLQMRAEASVRGADMVDLGGYAQRLQRFDAQGEQSGWGLGVLATFRPRPQDTVGVLAFGSLGYQRAPEGDGVYRDGLFFEIGGGLAWRATSILDLELRGGFVGLVGGERDLTGFTAGLAVSLHP